MKHDSAVRNEVVVEEEHHHQQQHKTDEFVTQNEESELNNHRMSSTLPLSSSSSSSSLPPSPSDLMRNKHNIHHSHSLMHTLTHSHTAHEYSGKDDDEEEGQADEQQTANATSPPLPQINEHTARLLDALDQKSRFLCENLAHLTGSLRSALHATSGMSRAYMELYEKSMLQFCDTVDGSVESMQDHVDRCTEMNQQLHDMKRLHAEMYVATGLLLYVCVCMYVSADTWIDD